MKAIKELKPATPAAVAAELQLARAIEQTVVALRGSRAVTVVLNDPQRGTASETVLSPLAAALPGVRWRALIATGSHHFHPARVAEFERRLRQLLPLDRIAWHDCLARELIEVGVPKADIPGIPKPGTSGLGAPLGVPLPGEGGPQSRYLGFGDPAPWRCHRWLLEDDQALLAIGSSEPHYFAGVTGAHKTASIGCADYGSIQRNHSAALSERARPGALEGNPVHEGIAAMVRSLEARREVLAVNLLQIGPTVAAGTFGRPLEALRRIAPLVRACCFCRIPAPAEALVLDVTGPLGVSFYQADKGIKNSEYAVRDGGALILVADCPDGVGQNEFLRLLRRCPTYEGIAQAVQQDGYRLGDHKAVKLRHLADRRGVRVFAVSDGLSATDAELLGLTPAQSVDSALAAAGIDPGGEGVYRVADAGNTCVIVA